MNKQVVVTTVKVALTAGLLATALAGCCCWRTDDKCAGSKEGCCAPVQECQKPKRGANASLTLGLGTDGVRMGSDANLGNHTMSANGGANAGCTGVSVDGGRRTPTDTEPAGKLGTAVSAFSQSSYESVIVTASPLQAVSARAGYGEYQFRGGETVVREADAIGGDPVNPQNVRYVCTGYVVSNATEQIDRGETTSLSFSVVKGEGPYTVTWLWNVRETRTQLNDFGPGDATVNGQAVNELWVADTDNVTFAATPQDGKAFWAWSGVDVPAASVAKSSPTFGKEEGEKICLVSVSIRSPFLPA